MLVWMGYGLLRSRPEQAPESVRAWHTTPILDGLTTMAANPYFFLGWATVGTMLLARGLTFGLWGLLAVAVTHWTCDLVWDTLLSFLTFHSRRLWTPLVHRLVLEACGLLLIGFGVDFATSTLLGG